MKRMFWFIVLLVLATVSFPVAAENLPAEAEVVGVQPPAWLERNDRRTPLSPGTKIATDSTIVTGEGARVRVNMPDGSVLRLGEQGRFSVVALDQAAGTEGEVSSIMRMVRGVFRFTTGLLERETARDISLEVGVYVVGIRGTDVWGRSTESEGDLFALIDGEVEVRIQGVADPVFPDPMTYLSREPAAEPAPFTRPIDPDTLAEWAAQTDLQPNEGVMEPEGPWQVVLISLQEESVAAGIAGELREAGYAARVEDARVNDTATYRVMLRGFSSRQDATTVGERLQARLELDDIWVRME